MKQLGGRLGITQVRILGAPLSDGARALCGGPRTASWGLAEVASWRSAWRPLLWSPLDMFLPALEPRGPDLIIGNPMIRCSLAGLSVFGIHFKQHGGNMINRTLSTNQIRQLTAELVPGITYQKQGLDYVKASYIHTRLNQIFGLDGWDQEVLRVDSQEARGTGHAFVAHVRLTIRSGDVVLVREGVGVGESDKLDTAYKGSVSDATKRAARTFGSQFSVMPDEERKVRQSWRFWQACSKALDIFAAKAKPEGEK